MSGTAWTKRNSDSPSDIMSLEYEALSDKMRVLAVKGDGKGYYEKRVGEIEMKWLIQPTLSSDLNYVWHANMPISFWQSKEVYEAAKKMPKASVRALVFPDYDLNADEDALFEVLYDYGRAVGLELVATRLYEGAESGDPRAIKMYLEVMDLIGGDNVEIDATKKLMRVSLNI